MRNLKIHLMINHKRLWVTKRGSRCWRSPIMSLRWIIFCSMTRGYMIPQHGSRCLRTNKIKKRKKMTTNYKFSITVKYTNQWWVSLSLLSSGLPLPIRKYSRKYFRILTKRFRGVNSTNLYKILLSIALSLTQKYRSNWIITKSLIHKVLPKEFRLY